MKRILYIFGMLISLFLLAPEKGNSGVALWPEDTLQTSVVEEGNASHYHHSLAELSSDPKESYGLMARRSIQTVGGNNLDIRIQKVAEKALRFIRLKEENRLHKVVVSNSDQYTVHLSTLFCRMGHHLFALRKLII